MIGSTRFEVVAEIAKGAAIGFLADRISADLALFAIGAGATSAEVIGGEAVEGISDFAAGLALGAEVVKGATLEAAFAADAELCADLVIATCAVVTRFTSARFVGDGRRLAEVGLAGFAKPTIGVCGASCGGAGVI
jgi:hypothetical protein